jgi:sulfatase maturation enzyme AslB (radical SAM superfamily)
MPWVGLSVETDQSFRLCCHFSHRELINDEQGRPLRFTEINQLSEIVNHAYLKQVRLEMLANKIPKACEGCHKSECATGYSPRLDYLKTLNHQLEETAPTVKSDGSITPKIAHFHYSTDNICNLRCRMCHPRYSKGIAKEWQQLGLVRPDDPEFSIDADLLSQLVSNSNIFENLIHDLKELKITGGEPFLSPYVATLLKKIAKHPKCSEIDLTIYTNATIYPSHIENELKQFKSVHLLCSIDAIGDLAEYIRTGCAWSEIDQNLRRFIALSERDNFSLGIVTTLTAYALCGLPELLDYLIQLKIPNVLLPDFNRIDAPTALTPDVLPERVLKKIKHDLQIFISNHPEIFVGREALRYQTILNSLYHEIDQALKNNPGQRYLDFLLFSKRLDHLRSQSLKQVLPHLDDQ